MMLSSKIQKFKTTRRTQKGVAIVELAILLSLVSLSAVVSVQYLGQTVSERLNLIDAALESERSFDTKSNPLGKNK